MYHVDYYHRWESDEHEPSLGVRGLVNSMNSCFIDSVLFALFAVPNKVLEKKMLFADTVISDELYRIVVSMRGGEQVQTCSRFRSLTRFSDGQAHDAGEFLQYLFDLFKLDIMIMETTVYGSHDLVSRDPQIYKTSHSVIVSFPIIAISPLKTDNINLENFLGNIEDSICEPFGEQGFRRKIDVTKILASPYVVFYVQRPHLENNEETVHRNPVKFQDEIKVGMKKLHLHAIVVHKYEHYCCYLKCGGYWFFYNDLVSNIEYVRDLETAEPSVYKDGVLYFYS